MLLIMKVTLSNISSAESVSDLVEVEVEGETDRLVYAAFTTPENAIGGNAICAFRLKVI